MIVYASFARSFLCNCLSQFYTVSLQIKLMRRLYQQCISFFPTEKKQNKKLFTNLSGHLCIRVVCVRFTTNNYCLGCLIS